MPKYIHSWSVPNSLIPVDFEVVVVVSEVRSLAAAGAVKEGAAI